MVDESLRESEEKYRTLIQKIQAAVVVHGADTQIIICNTKAQELLGLTEDQLLGKAAIDSGWYLFRENNTVMPLEEYPVNLVITTRQELRNYIIGLRRPDNDNNIWALVNADPVFDNKGDIEQVIVTFSDITSRKKMEEKLHQSEERFRRLAENARDVIYRMSLLEGKYDYISPATYSMFGYYPEEYYANPSLFKESIHPDWHQYFNEQWANLLKGEMPPTYEYQIIHKSGEVKWLNQRNILVCDDNGKPIAIEGIVTDITNHKHLEEELRKSEKEVKRKLETILSPEADIGTFELSDIIDSEMLQKLMNEFYRITNIGIGIIDLQGKVLVGTGWQDICTKFHRVNPKACKLCVESDLELSSNVAPGTFKLYHCKNNMWDIATPIMLGDKHVGNIFLGQFLFNDEKPDYETFRQQAKKYGFDEQEYIAALDRVPRWNQETVNATISFYSAFAGMIGNLSYSNIKLVYALEERKRMEKALQTSEWRYREIFDNVLDGLYLLDVTDDGRFRTIEVNPALERLTGIPRSFSVGKTQEETLPAEVAEILNAKYRRCVEAGHPIEEEVQLDLPSGKRYFHLTLIPAHDENEKTHRLIGISRDITDRKKAEEEIRKLNQDLEKRVVERTSQLEAVNKELESFAYSISHDLRAPLRHINGFMSQFIEQTNDLLDEKSRTYINKISDASKHMSTLIEDLLSFSRMGRLEMSSQRVNLGTLVNEIIQELLPDFSGRNIHWHISDLPEVTGDRSLLRAVMVNLISNAIKFTKPREQAEIEIDYQTMSTEIIVFVRDNGVGFDPNYANKLFGVFQRLHSTTEFEGTGIGLANVRRIIERHGGKTWAEGNPDKGATFYFSLPL